MTFYNDTCSFLKYMHTMEFVIVTKFHKPYSYNFPRYILNKFLKEHFKCSCLRNDTTKGMNKTFY